MSKFNIGDRVRVQRQKPNSNWAEGRTGRVHTIVRFEDRDPGHEPGDCFEVQLDDPALSKPGKPVGLTKRVANEAGQEREVPRTYPFDEAALEAE